MDILTLALAKKGGGGGGGFVLRPTAEELSVASGVITCTTNYDELAKAVEDNKLAYIVFPPSSITSDIPFGVKVLPNIWVYIPGQVFGCSIRLMQRDYDIQFVNGTYAPNL